MSCTHTLKQTDNLFITWNMHVRKLILNSSLADLFFENKTPAFRVVTAFWVQPELGLSAICVIQFRIERN